MQQTLERPSSASSELRDRTLAGRSGGFVLDAVTTGLGGLDTRDAILVLAINQANIAPLTRDPAARSRYGALETPAPDEERRPVSLSAVATSLCLPYETVRRRVRRLEARGVCVMTPSGPIVPEAFLASPDYLESARLTHERLLAFYRELRAADFLEALPASKFPPEPAIPVRAAARLLSDYLLRTAEGLMGISGDIISGLILLGVLSAAPSAPPAPVSIIALSRRVKTPQETARRHMGELVRRGLCVRAGRAFAMPEEVLSRPEFAAFFRDNAVNVQRLFAGLAERGVIDAWERLALPRGA